MVFLAAEEKEEGLPSPGSAEVAITGGMTGTREKSAPKKNEPMTASAEAVAEYLFLDIAAPPSLEGKAL